MSAILLFFIKILGALLVFGLIIFIHELGHFIAAKCMGVQVNEFALGMGPQLLKFGKGETTYSLRAFPIGGFCAMEGEDDGAPAPQALGGSGRSGDEGAVSETEDSEPVEQEPNPRAFNQKKVWKRIVIVVAGVFMNLLLGFALLLVYLPAFNDVYASTQVSVIEEDTVCYQSGLRSGDEILKIDGKRIYTTTDMTMILQSDEDGVLDFTVRREQDGKAQTVLLEDVTFRLLTDEQTGQRMLIYDFYVQPIQKTVGSTLVMAAKTEMSYAVMVWRSLGGLLTGQYGLNEVSGPIGTVEIIGDAVEQAITSNGLEMLILLVILITVNVGVFNLLPLPALDGGRLLFLIIEGVTRRKVPPKFENVVHLIGLLLLMVLMVVVAFSDIWKLIAR